jgi:hypothetical protein
MIIKQSTVYARKFLMVLSSDHINGATVAPGTITVMLSKGTGAAGTVAGGAVTQLDGANLPGWYQVAFTAADTSVAGDLGVHCTAATCDPTDFIDQVQGQVFTDLLLTGGGTGTQTAVISSNLKQNQPFVALFFMTQLGTTNPLPGLTVSGQRTFGVAGFSNVTGPIAEVGGANNGGGWYVFNGAAADSNSPTAGFKMSASGANDSDFSLWFQP